MSPPSTLANCTRVNSVQELAELCDENFVNTAYLTLLNRIPDPSGYETFLKRVRRGDNKLRIIWDISQSEEGRLRNVRLSGLITRRNHWRATASRLREIWFRFSGIDHLQRQIRISENEYGREMAEIEAVYRDLSKRALILEAEIREQGQGSAVNKTTALSRDIPVTTFDENSIIDMLNARRASGPLPSPQLDDDDLILPLPQGKRCLYIFVDHTVSCSVNTGVQRVVRGVASGFSTTDEQIRFVKWDYQNKKCVLISQSEREHLARWNGPEIRADEQGTYPTDLEAATDIPFSKINANNWLIVPEVTHLTPHPLPVTLELISWAKKAGLSTGFVFYDAIPLRREELQGAVPQHRQYMQHLRLADVVWPISDWSRDDLIAYWSESERATAETIPEVKTIPLPGQSTHTVRVTSVKAGKPLILSVGSIEPRKNQITLIRAFQAFRKKNPGSPWELVLIGNLHPDVSDEVYKATKSDAAIKYLGHVNDMELDGYYKDCAFTVFPSVEEGFGLPILESLWYAKPCLCADFGAMAEVAKGGGCHMVDTRKPKDVQKGLERLIANETLRAQLANEATQRVFSTWANYIDVIVKRMDQNLHVHETVGKIYYWVNSTIEFPKNTGIQRVNRQLARSLIHSGFKLIPVKWDKAISAFAPISDADKDHLAKWNGPPKNGWQSWSPPSAQSDGWLLMTELPLDLTTEQQREVLTYSKSKNLRTSIVFYDATSWILKDEYPDFYSDVGAKNHKEYMQVVGEYDLILSISKYTRESIAHILGIDLEKPFDLDNLIKDVALAGEFPDTVRITEPTCRLDNQVINVLCVGTVEPRKNHRKLVEAFILAENRSTRPMRLTLVGRDCTPHLTGDLKEIIENTPSITWEMDADDKQLQKFYEDCDFTAYPSHEEGFGLPILESIWHGKPCLCANFGAMLEVAEEGGCLTVNVRDVEALANGLLQLSNDTLRKHLTNEAIGLPIKSWDRYAREVSERMAQFPSKPQIQLMPITEAAAIKKSTEMRLGRRPKLSVCISTYNRAEWLARSLDNLFKQFPEPLTDIEFLVCDNTSTDHTPDIITPFLERPDFTYKRNPVNVGMLGNLRETANYANGDYIWIVGDDDLIMPGAIERVVKALRDNPGAALIYLNYAYTRIEDARTVTDLHAFFRDATPIVPPEPNLIGPIKTICARNENFFTAIYTLVLRRDHAINAYSQDTSGRPFSTLMTAAPTTHYILNHMMNELGVWIGTPQLVVNLNVSWMKYAPLWILERVPEFYDIAERNGAATEEVNRWRRHTAIHGIEHFFREIFENDPVGNASYFKPLRLVHRFKHLEEFSAIEPRLKAIYEKAHLSGHPAARHDPSYIFQV